MSTCKYCLSTENTVVDIPDGKRWTTKLVCALCNRWIKFLDKKEKTPDQVEEAREKRNKIVRENLARKRARLELEFEKQAISILENTLNWNKFDDNKKREMIFCEILRIKHETKIKK